MARRGKKSYRLDDSKPIPFGSLSRKTKRRMKGRILWEDDPIVHQHYHEEIVVQPENPLQPQDIEGDDDLPMRQIVIEGLDDNNLPIYKGGTGSWRPIPGKEELFNEDPEAVRRQENRRRRHQIPTKDSLVARANRINPRMFGDEELM